MDLVEAAARGFSAQTRHPWEQARLALAARLIASEATLAPGALVLDIGCGDTFVVESLAARFPHADFVAVDSAFTPQIIAALTARLHVANVRLAASLDAVDLDRPVALVLLMDVLEHVDADHAMLRDLVSRPWSTPATTYLLTVPAYPGLFCAHDRFLGHYRRYSVRAFGRLLAAAQLRPLVQGRLFASLVPVRVLQVMWERVSPPRPGEGHTGLTSWNGGRVVAACLAAVLELDGLIGWASARAGLPAPGLSLFAVCRKSA